MKSYKHEMDMTEGPLFKKIVIFSLPLILTGLLQCFYNAADLIVVGRFSDEAVAHIALAAVGSTGALNNLVVGLFMGLSVGAGVCAAQYVGAKQYDRVHKVIHTSVLTAIILGIVVGAFGFIFARDMLELMGTPDNVIYYSTLYIRIIFCGVPFLLLYNYCAAILRSTGDTKHPLIFLTISGIVNVCLNIVMVAVFNMGVAGVAIATLASQVLSAVMIVVYMARSDSYIKISLKELRISKKYLGRMMLIGVPSGIQGSLFSLSNVIIQSSINSFGDVVMAGNSAAANIEGFVWIAMNALHQAAITFVGQNVGAKKYNRIGKVLLGCFAVLTIMWAVSAGAAFIFREPLLRLYAGDAPNVISAGLARMMIILPSYVLCGYMDTICGALRAMGKSVSAMILTLIGVCGVRILWVQTVFKVFNTPMSVYLSYPVSWTIATVGNLTMFILVYRKTLREDHLPEGEFDFLKNFKLKRGKNQ